MNKIEKKIGIMIGLVLAILLFLMTFGNDIDSINSGRVLTPKDVGAGVFYSMTDLITFTTFIIGCTLSVLYFFLIIGKRSNK